jgi:uncharacterized protein
MDIKRPFYLNQLVSGMHNGLIKIVTGIRRCGKSYLLFNLFYGYLRTQGISRDHIIELALDDVLNEQYCDPKALVLYIKGRIVDDEMHYVLLDEVQMVKGFVGALNSLLHIRNVDVYVTGSNSRFLSSDVATEFRGRGDEIRVFPLSFAEYLSAYDGSKDDAWRDYITYGGLPHLFALDTVQKKTGYLRNIYTTLYLRDIIERNGIKKSEELDNLVHIMASTIGSPCNPNKLSNTFKTVAKTDVAALTISHWLDCLQDAFIIEKALRYDIKGRKYVGTLSKYYFSDSGVRNAILDFRQSEETHLMENAIYNELRMRGFLVDVGMVEVRQRDNGGNAVRQQLEVDFVANQGSKRYYIQSALTLPTREKAEQESASLMHVADNFKKVIVVKDNIVPHHNDNGILLLSLYDFLLNPDALEM